MHTGICSPIKLRLLIFGTHGASIRNINTYFPLKVNIIPITI